MSGDAAFAAVMPTLGRSPVLIEALEALAAQTPKPRIVLVHSGGDELPTAAETLADVVLDAAERLGFAAAMNRGLDATDEAFVAAVNDDVVVGPDWAASLLDLLASRPDVAAAQGVNTVLDQPDVVDGCGIGWNAWWQAVQLSHGEPSARVPAEPFDTGGASATATIYRRSALDRVALPDGSVFDPAFDSYYEDVDLALRLAGRGLGAVCVPAARAGHVGSATGITLGKHRLELIYGNRLLTLWRAGGLRLLPRLPKVLLRDLLDAARRPVVLPAVLGGWWRALVRIGSFEPLGSGRDRALLLRRIARRGAS